MQVSKKGKVKNGNSHVNEVGVTGRQIIDECVEEGSGAGRGRQCQWYEETNKNVVVIVIGRSSIFNLMAMAVAAMDLLL